MDCETGTPHFGRQFFQHYRLTLQKRIQFFATKVDLFGRSLDQHESSEFVRAQHVCLAPYYLD
ncbi:hypothetical protein SAMN05192539_1015123 [Paraburkholderia diazotrophica]|uniref:Uncharacterized protein n=1 Tax=Paraburkholderia diazotrophica TaxID=667676 RepID=A0A1H7AQY3_9BURK|nr:hypothetical protein SAMN05192539_1015123 [Paraburkholderia diazotrophica]